MPPTACKDRHHGALSHLPETVCLSQTVERVSEQPFRPALATQLRTSCASMVGQQEQQQQDIQVLLVDLIESYQEFNPHPLTVLDQAPSPLEFASSVSASQPVLIKSLSPLTKACSGPEPTAEADLKPERCFLNRCIRLPGASLVEGRLSRQARWS